MRAMCVLVVVLCPIAATAQPDRRDSGAGGLATLVSELDAHNPELAAARREVDVHVARIGPAGAPPDPTLSVGYMSGVWRPPFFPSSSTPDGARQFAVIQELPYPGTLRARTGVAVAAADAARWDYEETRLRLVADVKAQYFEYVAVLRTIDIVQRSRVLLDHFREIAEARFAVGKGTQQDVLRAQLEMSLLLERLSALEQQRLTVQAEINRLLDRAPETAIDAASIDDPPALLPRLDDLRAQAAEHSPSVRRDEQAITGSQQALRLARQESLPVLAVNLTARRLVGDMPWMYGVDLMVSVPVFWQRKQRQVVAEAFASLEATRRAREAGLADVAAAVTQEYAAARTSADLVDLYRGSILPQAQLALEASLAAYETGQVDFLTVVTNFLTTLTYEINIEAQRAAHLQALARLERLTAAELIP